MNLSEHFTLEEATASSTAQKTGFYAYIHRRPDGTEFGYPFYVGKGRGKRAYKFSRKYNPYYQRIVNKYGRENISVEVIPVGTEADAFEVEKSLIKEYREWGFKLANCSDGGEGLSNPTEETRRKMSRAQRGSIKGPLTHEARRKITLGLLGKKFSAERKERLKLAHIGKKPNDEVRAKMKLSSPKRKPVICIETGEIFSSMRQAAIAVRGTGNGISDAIRKNWKCKGYHYKFADMPIVKEGRR